MDLIKNNIRLTIFALAIAAFGFGNETSFGQDTVFLNSGRPIRGKVANSTPDAIQVGTETVSIQDIKKISLAGEPRELGRAKNDMDSGQYEDAWAELQKITETQTGMVLQEQQYIEGFLMGKLSLQGGSVSTADARAKINQYLQKYPNSFRAYPLTELYGELLVATNELAQAEVAFQKLSTASITDYQIKNLFNLGQTQLLLEKFAAARTTFETLQNHKLNDVNAQNYKTLARCLAAKADVLSPQGQAEPAQAVIEKIIKNENPDNTQLFAHCYNALGICHLKNNDDKGAALAFLHTDLLFSTEADAHAEALYHLNKLWSKMEQNDRANRSRQILNANYGNSIWKSKMDTGS